jgi:hypothetical protein
LSSYVICLIFGLTNDFYFIENLISYVKVVFCGMVVPNPNGNISKKILWAGRDSRAF